MNVTRVFHPVGQGGFYTETFDVPQLLMTVYDCGGNSVKSMEDYLKSFLPEKKDKVDTIVFISHLHFDHINGLNYLLNNANVIRLCLPQLTPERILETTLYNAINFSQSSNEYVNSIIDSFTTGQYKNDVTYIRPTGELFRENRERETNIKGRMPLEMESGSQIYVDTASNPRWVYIPYNPTSKKPDFSSPDKHVQLLKTIYESFPDKLCQEIASVVKNLTHSELISIYKKIFGSIHNSQSMAVFSGLLFDDDRMKIRDVESNLFASHCGYFWDYDRYCCMHEGKCPCNFLYTGDYENRSKSSYPDIRNFYKNSYPNVWDTICGIQIPHHGSRKNHYQRIYEKKCFAVASVGVHNRYHHPNIDTLLNIYNQGCMPIVVTEDINTLKYQHFMF